MKTTRLRTTIPALGISLVLAGLGAAPALASIENNGGTAVVAQDGQTKTVTIDIEDPRSYLSPSAAEALHDSTAKLDVPDVVKNITYILIPGQPENLNDDIVRWLDNNRPDLVPDGIDEGKTFANGSLIIAVGVTGRTNGIYCGDDVCNALDMLDGPHLEHSLEQMKDPFRDGKYGTGLFRGAEAAVDTELGDELREQEARDEKIALTAFGGAGAVAATVGGVWYTRRRKEKTKTARQQFAELSRTYGSLAQRLDSIDIRANSLSSPLANAELRSQWREVRDDFLNLDQKISRLNLTVDSEDKAFYAKYKDVAEAHEVLESMGNAEDNINLMFDLENGDEVKRERELVSIRQDLHEALSEVKNREVIRQLHLVEDRVNILLDDVSVPNFMDELAVILSDQGHAMDMAARDMKHLERAKHQAPSLRDSNWRPGYVYGNWVPWYLLATWNSADTQAASSGSGGSGISTGFSGGFAGGGGSGSW